MGEAALRRITVDEFLAWDSGDYRHIPSVQSIVFIASEEKRVEWWRRGTDLWTVIELEGGGILPLDAIGFDIPVEALYVGPDLSQAAGATA